MTKIRTATMDIALVDNDAIVNSANPRLICGSGISYAIHKAAGGELEKECLAILKSLSINELPVGESILTHGYNLPSKNVIHVVGPVYDGNEERSTDLLRRAYNSCLQLANKNGIRTIAFPAISCGIYGFPKDKAAEIAIKTINDYTLNNPDDFEEILFVFASDSHRYLFEQTLATFILSPNIGTNQN